MPEFTTSRTTHINAAPAVVHALVSDFREWPQWSPWEGLDPDLQRSYTGPPGGVGSRYAWTGNNKAGTGTMEVMKSDPSRVEIALEFVKPFRATNTTLFDLTPTAAGTDLTWTMTGKRGVLMTLMGKLHFDKAIGQDFDKGLAAIKAVAERA